MSRKISEWKGQTDDEAVPARVKVRIFEKCNGKCAVCTLPICGKLRPAYDHITALINGGHNWESNLQLLCVPCHKVKTGDDVALKSKNYRVRAKHLGITKSSRFPGSRNSRWKKKVDGTVVPR